MITAAATITERSGDAPPIAQDRRAVPLRTALVVLVLVGGVVPIAFAWHFGALGIPRNDDWAYAPAAFRFADSGKVSGNGWAGVNLVGQLVLAWPVVRLFGHRIAALQVEVAALGVVGLLATFDLAKQWVSPRRALFVAALVAVLPMWASLSTSFMTDVPSFALTMTCLALGARGVARGSVRLGYFCASLAVGCLAFTVRENAIIALFAVCAVTVWVAARRSGSRLSPIVAMSSGVLASAVLFYVWRRSLPGFINPRPQLPSFRLANQAVLDGWQSALLLALLVSPAVVLADPRRLLRSAWTRAPRAILAVGALTAGVLGVVMLRQGPPVAVLGPGDYVLPNGTLGTEMLRGARPDLFPRSVLAVVAIIGVASLFVLVAAALAATADVTARRRRRRDTTTPPAFHIVAIAAFGYAVSCVLPVALGYADNLFDRYLLPIVPLVAILVLGSGGRTVATPHRARIAGCTALAALAFFGAVYGANAASFDGTKWSVARHAVNLAGNPKRVDGGHIWNDYHQARHIRGPFKGACIALRAEPRPATGEAGIVAVGSVWGLTGTQVRVVAHQLRPC